MNKDYYSTDYETRQAHIQVNEHRDRYVANRMINDFISEGATNISVTPMDLFCPYDLNLTCDVPVPEYNTTAPCDVNIEVKERFKTDEQLKKYPNVELKVSKYEEIMAASRGKHVFYFVLLNQKTGYIFHINNLPTLQGVYTFYWRLRRVQYDPNSEMVEELTYSIPTSLARCTMDITKYYDEYNANYIQE